MTQRFDKARETLLDVFRDAADFWFEQRRGIRVFYSFSVTCTPDRTALQGVKTNRAPDSAASWRMRHPRRGTALGLLQRPDGV